MRIGFEAVYRTREAGEVEAKSDLAPRLPPDQGSNLKPSHQNAESLVRGEAGGEIIFRARCFKGQEWRRGVEGREYFSSKVF